MHRPFNMKGVVIYGYTTCASQCVITLHKKHSKDLSFCLTDHQSVIACTHTDAHAHTQYTKVQNLLFGYSDPYIFTDILYNADSDINIYTLDVL